MGRFRVPKKVTLTNPDIKSLLVGLNWLIYSRFKQKKVGMIFFINAPLVDHCVGLGQHSGLNWGVRGSLFFFHFWSSHTLYKLHEPRHMYQLGKWETFLAISTYSREQIIEKKADNVKILFLSIFLWKICINCKRRPKKEQKNMVSWRSNIKVKAKVKTRYKMPIFCPSSANKVKVYHFSVGYLDILGIFFQTVLGVLVKHLYFALVLSIKLKFTIFWSVIWTFQGFFFKLC